MVSNSKVELNVKNSGVRMLFLPISSPIIKDENGNIIPYKIVADMPGLDYALIAAKFPAPGKYKVEKGTPIEDNSLLEIIKPSDIAKNQPVGSGSIQAIEAFYPIFEKRIRYDDIKPSSGHLQGVAIDDNGNVWISVQSDLYLINTKSWKVIDHIDISKWFHDGQQHFGDIDYFNGYIYGAAENWQGSGQNHSPIEIWKIDPTSHKLVEKIPCSTNIKEAASVHIKDNNTIYIADYDNAKIYVVDSSCNLIKTIDVSTHISYIQGVTLLDNGMLAVTGDSDTGPVYCVCDENLQTVNILENYSSMIIEGIDAKNGVVIAVWQKCTTCDTFIKVYAQGETLILKNTNGTNGGGNLIAPVEQVEEKSYIIFAETEGVKGGTATNKAPGIAAYVDDKNLIVLEFTTHSVGPTIFTNGNYDTSNDVEYDDLPFPEFKSSSSAPNKYIIEGMLALINNNGNLSFYIQDINDIYKFTKSLSRGNNNNIGIRNWRLITFISPLIKLNYTGDPPQVDLIVEESTTPTKRKKKGKKRRWIKWIALGFIGLLMIVGRKRRVD